MIPISPPITNDALSKVGIVRSLSQGARFDRSNVPVEFCYAVIESGALLLYSNTPANKKYCLALLGSGHIFTPDSMSNQLGPNSVLRLEAIRPTQLRWLAAADWHQLVCSEPALLEYLVQQDASALNAVKFHTLQHHKRCSLALARFALANYARALGRANECGSLTFKITKRELAEWLHVSVDRASRLVNQLRDEGALMVEGRLITVSVEKIMGVKSPHLPT